MRRGREAAAAAAQSCAALPAATPDFSLCAQNNSSILHRRFAQPVATKQRPPRVEAGPNRSRSRPGKPSPLPTSARPNPTHSNGPSARTRPPIQIFFFPDEQGESAYPGRRLLNAPKRIPPSTEKPRKAAGPSPSAEEAEVARLVEAQLAAHREPRPLASSIRHCLPGTTRRPNRTPRPRAGAGRAADAGGEEEGGNPSDAGEGGVGLGGHGWIEGGSENREVVGISFHKRTSRPPSTSDSPAPRLAGASPARPPSSRAVAPYPSPQKKGMNTV
ncbi:hypothetical protein ZWY2020_052070 [Hordeum vulgare]|nr:hypothetical protein ZWY2020_052070 [Hordeum vulgare]